MKYTKYAINLPTCSQTDNLVLFTLKHVKQKYAAQMAEAIDLRVIGTVEFNSGVK